MVLMWIYSLGGSKNGFVFGIPSHTNLRTTLSGSTDRFLMSYTLPSPLCSSDPGPHPGLCLQPCLGHLGWGRWCLERHGQCDLQHGTLSILQLLCQQQLYPRWTWMWTHLQRPGICTGNTVFEPTQLNVSNCHRCDAMVVYGVVNVVVGTIFVEFFVNQLHFSLTQHPVLLQTWVTHTPVKPALPSWAGMRHWEERASTPMSVQETTWLPAVPARLTAPCPHCSVVERMTWKS